MKKRRNRELTLSAAMRYGLLVALGMGILLLVILVMTPGTAFGNFFIAQTQQVPLSGNSELYQQLQAKMDDEEALILSPICLFFGGLTLGRLAPRTADLKRVLLGCAKMALGLVLLDIAFSWGGILYAQQWHLARGQVTQHMVLAQMGAIALWTVCALIGTACGVLWRNRSALANTANPKLSTTQ